MDISEMICGPGFRGCPFINAAVEYPAPGSPIHQAVDAHRTWFHTTLLDLFIAAGHPEPEEAARRLVLLRDGAMIGGYLGAPAESIASLHAGLDELLIPCDPDTKSGGSPTVWIEDERHEIVIQGWKADAVLEARIGGTEWVPGHARDIPDHEAVVRIPMRMIPILRKACDDAERAGLFRPAEGGAADGRAPGDA
jgi:hypothetical protein